MHTQQTTTHVWEETVSIPTYGVGEPNAHPMFFDNRVYQGSSGRVYPYPIIETIENEKHDKPYTAVFLENEYLKLMILPQLGGRIQRAYDKTNGYDFVYYNEVIKPALVGLTGPWISGGIEFNWPQHHRPTTYMPVDYLLRENDDGSCTVLLNDVDRIHGTKAVTTITLYPGKAYIEISARLFNRTQLPQTFLWWANPAIAVNDTTQSIFPPDVHAVMDHGKRDVTTFPIATGVYYKHDYSAGVDISRYKNIPVPTSYMAYHSNYDFVGSYDYQKQAGILHVADHHISPGKKQWTWGCGDFGKAWDRNLTDENGPYIELMTGVFTDNQPDFTWMHPYEEKTFTQYFLPYKQVGSVTNGSKDIVLSLQVQPANQTANLVVYASSQVLQAKIVLTKGKKETLFSMVQDLSPNQVFSKEIRIPVCQEEELEISVYSPKGNLMLSYKPEGIHDMTLPKPAMAIGDPKTLKTIEELWLAGQHLEQYRHATFSSDPYYLEALARDPEDYRTNCAYGMLLFRRGLFTSSEKAARTAIKRSTKHNPNPTSTEAYTLLGLSLFHQEREDEAFDAFYKAIWDGNQQEISYYFLAIISARREQWETALGFTEAALEKNSHQMKARGLKILLLNKLGKTRQAEAWLHENLAIDAFDLISRFELLKFHPDTKDAFLQLLRNNSTSYILLASDYAEMGFFQKAYEVLGLCTEQNPLLLYHRAWYAEKKKKLKGIGIEEQKAEENTNELATEELIAQAEAIEDAAWFPNSLTDLHVLTFVTRKVPQAAKAHFLLGCLWYDKIQYAEAQKEWELAVTSDPHFAKAWRTLSLGYFNIQKEEEKAIQAMEQAYTLAFCDSRILFELDQLYKKCGKQPTFRKQFLDRHLDLVFSRDDLCIEYVSLLNLLGDFDTARELELSHIFHPWEGGEGKITTQYSLTFVELGKQDLISGNFEKAEEALQAVFQYPLNLNEGKLEGNKDNDAHYFLGCIAEAEGDMAVARQEWQLSTLGDLEPSEAIYYNDQSAHQLLYKGLAFRKLGDEPTADKIFTGMLTYGNEHMQQEVHIDYFAVSLPDLQVFSEDLNKKHVAHCHYLMGLGNLGLGNKKEAYEELQATLQMDPAHSYASVHTSTLIQELREKGWM
ncbi:DUF5107 domain-containing protein [uncultured Sphaerochaeta sp.]|uniref:DUF5107 domain-containing protein n=1 Tax=uncultured Sphaerochaeta sp. TaxID=886478 RepID=UPI002A0A7E07|nr:DUF5107 domain-containing protein [uncultured Sphaerochaeta sp.]